MPDPTKSPVESDDDVQKRRDDRMIKWFHSIWQRHRAKDIRIRHWIGKLLNKRLGPPSKRQPYAASIVKQVADELGIDETNISRFRRFADKFVNYRKFCEEHPNVTSWTDVRDLITKPRKSASGRPRAWALVRSLRSAVKSLRSPQTLDSSRADEVSLLLQELFAAVHSRGEIRLPKLNESE